MDLGIYNRSPWPWAPGTNCTGCYIPLLRMYPFCVIFGSSLLPKHDIAGIEGPSAVALWVVAVDLRTAELLLSITSWNSPSCTEAFRVALSGNWCMKLPTFQVKKLSVVVHVKTAFSGASGQTCTTVGDSVNSASAYKIN